MSKLERGRLLREIAKQEAKAKERLEASKAKELEKAKEKIHQKIKDEKFLERQALHFIEKKKRPHVITSDVLDAAPEIIQEEIKKTPIAFEPNSDKQIWFLNASEDEVLFGGGRGGGKSSALIADPLRYIGMPNFRAVIIRRTMPELRELIDRAKEMYFKSNPGVIWKVKESLFLFSSGAKIEFGYLDSENDLEKYRGQEYTWIGVDEITQIPDYSWYFKLKASLRTSDATLTTYMRATCNPTGIGIDWVKEYFGIGIHPANTTQWTVQHTPIGTLKSTKKWINSTVYDNKTLIAANPQYVAQLMAAPPHLRKAWLDGDWDAIEGAAFQEFDRSIHVCEPFPVPRGWRRFRGADYGYGDGAACVWITVAPDGTHYCYREFVVNGRNSEKKYNAIQFAEEIIKCEEDEVVRYGVLDSSVWANRGDSGPSLAEQMIRAGTRWRPADKSKGSRVAGKNTIHQMLQVNPDTGKPRLIFFSNCLNVIKMMVGIPIDDNNAEDVDTDHPLDHQYDALRYVLMSRPNAVGYNMFSEPKPIIHNSTFFG